MLVFAAVMRHDRSETGVPDGRANDMKMPSDDIKAEWFYDCEEDKTKLNWFLYEVALEYHLFIRKADGLKAYRKSQGDRNVARFCTYYAKRMEKNVLDRLYGRTDATVIDEDIIADFYPDMDDLQTRRLLNVACQAWDSLLSVCETCPTRCLSEKERKSEYFDRYKDGFL
jgi:hypothetical protein